MKEETLKIFESKTSIRKCGHESVDNFLWVTSDKGAFGNEKDGPLRDWIEGKSLFMKHVKKFDTVIQAGGNCGMYPRFYKNYFKNVYTFEPSDLNFYCLNLNCVGEGYYKFKGGLGNTNSNLSLNDSDTKNVGTHTIIEKPGNVKMYKIDDLNLSECDLIHLDIEGYEESALKGAVKTIENFNPVIITERKGGEKLIKSMGYSVVGQSHMDTIYSIL